MDISVYIHIPFCIKKCRYCDFVSVCIGEQKKSVVEAYIAALINEINAFDATEYSLKSVFIGGGTPSSINERHIAEIVHAINLKFAHKNDKIEFSIEANPATLTHDKLHLYRELGINRLSIGLQSTDNSELSMLGRIHTYEEFVQNYNMARQEGFNNINIDLISAIPNQTLSSWKTTLNKVVELNPEHISAYSLIVEENTEFYKLQKAELLPLPDEDVEREMYSETEKILCKAGYFRYEISNYAKAGFECEHNKVYWTMGEYVGFGVAAASKYMNKRMKNTNSIEEYILKKGIEVVEEYSELTRKENIEEYMFLGLRMMKGVDRQRFLQEFNESIETIYGKEIEKLMEQGLLQQEEECYRLTPKGIDISNYVFETFLLD